MVSFVHGKLYRKLITTLLNLWIAILSQFFARACNRTVERSVRLSPALGKELVVAMYSWTNSPMEQKAVSQLLQSFGLACAWNPSGSVSRLSVIHPAMTTDADVASILWVAKQLPTIQELSLCYTQITDKSLRKLAKVTNVESMRLIGNNMTTKGLSEFTLIVPSIRLEC